MMEGQKTMRRYKRVFGVASFLAIGLTLTILTCYVLRPATRDFFRDRFIGFYGEEDDSLDVVGLGSSALYRYFSSPALYEYTGITSYPLATAGQSVFAIENLIDEILKTQSPQLLVIESRKFLLTKEKRDKENRFRLITDNMFYSWNRVSLINKLVDDWETRLSYYFDIMLYHENWENLDLSSLEYLFNTKKHQLKGWENNAMHKAFEKPDLTDATGELPLSEASEEALLGVIEKCRKKNLEVLFVVSPYVIDSDTQKKSNYMRRIVEENGFRFLDCNLCVDEMGLDYGVDFYNRKHTNSIGADKFTKYLGEYILENYDIDTDHSPEVAADWERAAQENRVLCDEASEKVLAKVQRKLERASAQ